MKQKMSLIIYLFVLQLCYFSTVNKPTVAIYIFRFICFVSVFLALNINKLEMRGKALRIARLAS